MRRWLYGISAVVVLWAAVAVPMPFLEQSPGTPYSVSDLIEVEAVTPLNGELHLLTVYVRQPGILEVVRARFDDTRVLNPVNAYIPEDVDPDEYFANQRVRFARSFDIAAAVGENAAGLTVEAKTGAVIQNIVEGSPASRMLFLGDIISAVDGIEVVGADGLVEAARDATMGQRFLLTVQRDGEELEVPIETATIPGLDRPGLGVSIGDAVWDLILPVEVTLAEGSGIGGPSAGMMIALTVYDLLSEEDLAKGRYITGTGTIQLDGTVGRIGGVAQKLTSAVRAGADIFIVPASQLGDALAVGVQDEIEIIAVENVYEAIDALLGRSPHGADQATIS